MRPLLLAALLAAAPAAASGAAAPEAAAGLRLGWDRPSGAAVGALDPGAPAPEVFVEVARAGKPLALELSMSGYALNGTENGNAVYTTGSGSTPTSYVFSQRLLVVPFRLTAKLGPRRKAFDAHLGAGIGGVVSYIDRTLTFGDPAAQSALGQLSADADLSFEMHAQAGADWRLGRAFRLGALARWSAARSGVSVYRGFRRADSTGAYFSEGGSAGNVTGLFAALVAAWEF